MVEIQETLQDEETVEILVNRLIKKLKSEGKGIQCNEDDKGLGCLTIWVFDLGTDKARIKVEPLFGKWDIRINPAFNEF